MSSNPDAWRSIQDLPTRESFREFSEAVVGINNTLSSLLALSSQVAQALGVLAAAGSTGLAADAGHVHPFPTQWPVPVTFQQAVTFSQGINLIPPGTLLVLAGAGTPAGCLDCDGTAYSRTTYAALFAAIGTTWGAGDGSSTFNVPDTRGRVLMGYGTGTAAGATSHALGSMPTTGVGGEENHTLTTAEIPAHKHEVGLKAEGVVTGGNLQLGSSGNTFVFDSAGTTGVQGSIGDHLSYSAGGGGSHNIMQPHAAVHCVIKY